MQVIDAMTRQPEAVDGGASLKDVAVKMRELEVGAVPVMEDGKLSGIITDRDLVLRGLAEGEEAIHGPVKQIMSTDPVCCTETDDLDDAIQLMEKNRIRRIPVTDAERTLTGVLTLGDVSKKAKPKEAGAALRSISSDDTPTATA